MKSRFSPTLWILSVAGGLAAIGCGVTGSSESSTPGALTAPGSQAQATMVRGTALSRIGGTSSAGSSRPVAGVRVSVAGNRQSAITDGLGHFTLVNAPLGRNQLQFDNQGTRGSVNVDLLQGKELHLAVELNAASANLVCQSQQPAGNTNAANACDRPAGGGSNGNNGTSGGNNTGGNTGNGGNNGSNGSNGGNGGNGGN